MSTFGTLRYNLVFELRRDFGDRGVEGTNEGLWDQLYRMRRDKLNGRVEAVTVTSPSFGTSSETFFSKFRRVAPSSCGGAWKWIWLVGVDNDGFLI